MKVSASEAAYLVSRHERIVRGRIKRGDLPAVKERNAWRIDPDDLERIPGWHVDRGRLAQLEERSAASVETMAARLASVERELAAVRARLRVLEQRSTPAPSADDAPYPQAPESHYSANLVQRLGTFANRSEAARFLVRHGLAESTARSWWKGAGWPAEPRDALADALQRPRADWRVTWRLHRCDDDECPCRELLPS